MQGTFLTGLKLKNNLTSQLVLTPLCSKNSYLPTAEMFAGTHVDQLFTLAAIWDMLGSVSTT